MKGSHGEDEHAYLVFQVFGTQALSSAAFPGMSYKVIAFSDMLTHCVREYERTTRAEGDIDKYMEERMSSH